jgi:hypothetical protein
LVATLLEWLKDRHVDSALVDAIGKYPRSNGEGSVISITAHLPQYHGFTMDHNTLGWDNSFSLHRNHFMPLDDI